MSKKDSDAPGKGIIVVFLLYMKITVQSSKNAAIT